MPKRRTNPTPTKRRKETLAKHYNLSSFFSRSISWRYCFMDTQKWTAIGQLDELRSKLVSYERMTWAEIDGASKSKEGSKITLWMLKIYAKMLKKDWKRCICIIISFTLSL